MDTDRTDDPWSLAAADAARLTSALGRPDAAVVMGSGWAGVGTALGELTARIDMSDLAGIAIPTVQGHDSSASAVRVNHSNVVVLAGRSHLYEGHRAHTVVHAVRCAVMAGARTVVLTNAAGSLHAELGVGTPVVLRDQLNLTGANPMAGPPPPAHLAGRFTDLSNLFDPRLRQVALEADDGAAEGVYAGVLGGSYETPAEIRMLTTMGADVVGMSTVLESIAAHHLGASVVGISLVTNLAAGLQADLDHTDVLSAAEASSDRLVGIIRAVLTAAD